MIREASASPPYEEGTKVKPHVKRGLWAATFGLLLLSGAEARAESSIGLRSYDLNSFKAVDGMGKQLAVSRDEMDGVLFTMTSAQRAVQRAKKDHDQALSRYGADSHDAVVSEGRYRRVKREQIKKTLGEMQVLVPKLKSAEQANKRRLQTLLRDKKNFQRLVRGHLEGKRNAAVLATLVYLATKRLSARAEELYGNVLLGKIDADIKEVRQTMDLVGRLLDPNVTTASIDQAWDELNPTDILGKEDEGTIDELDRLLRDQGGQ